MAESARKPRMAQVAAWEEIIGPPVEIGTRRRLVPMRWDEVVPKAVAGSAAVIIMPAALSAPREARVEKEVRGKPRVKEARAPPRAKEEVKAPREAAGSVEGPTTPASAPTRAREKAAKARVPMAFGKRSRMNLVGRGPMVGKNGRVESKASAV